MSEQRAQPPELFCVAGWTSRQILEHEELLFQQHEVGAIQLHDRGRARVGGASLRRWRMSWRRYSGGAVHAALATREHADGVQLWFTASCEQGWGWGVSHPLERLSLHRYPILDLASGLATTGVQAAATPEDIVRIARDRRIDNPVLVLDSTDADVSREAAAFRSATVGAVAMVVMEEAAARHAAARLSSQWRIPEGGARLFLPPWWPAAGASGRRGAAGASGRRGTTSVDAESSQADWEDLVRTALHAASWRASEALMPVDDDTWRTLLAEPLNDQRVALARDESAQWPSKRTGAGGWELRRGAKGDGLAELREVAAQHERTGAELDDFTRRATEELASLSESRRRLTRGVLRLRAERNAAQDRIANTTVGEAQRRSAAYERLVRARAELLHARRDERTQLRHQVSGIGSPGELSIEDSGLSWEQVLAEARRLPRIRLGEQISAPSGPHSAAAAYRCRHLFELLNRYRHGPVAEHLRRGGIPALLLGSVETEPAVRFPITRSEPAGPPATEWVHFTDYVRLDHGTVPPLVLHHYAEPDGLVHIGHIGRSLCRGIT